MGTTIYHLVIASTERKIFDDFIQKVLVNSSQGKLEIFSQHALLLTVIKPGMICITKQIGDKEYLYLTGGILETQSNSVIVLADKTICDRDLDKTKSLKSKCKKIEENIYTVEEYIYTMHIDVTYVKGYVKLAEAIAKLRLIETSHRTNKKIFHFNKLIYNIFIFIKYTYMKNVYGEIVLFIFTF